jgi:hypothetical protein
MPTDNETDNEAVEGLQVGRIELLEQHDACIPRRRMYELAALLLGEGKAPMVARHYVVEKIERILVVPDRALRLDPDNKERADALEKLDTDGLRAGRPVDYR